MIRRKRLFKITTLVTLIVVLACVLFPSAGVIRGQLVPQLVKTFYMPSLDQAFSENFTPVNQELNDLGITFNLYSLQYHDCLGSYSFLSETVDCGQTLVSSATSTTPSFDDLWHDSFPKLHGTWINNGWVFDTQTPASAFSDLTQAPQSGLEYEKKVGQVTCMLEINLLDSSRYSPAAVQVEEQCNRSVSFFGGY